MMRNTLRVISAPTLGTRPSGVSTRKPIMRLPGVRPAMSDSSSRWYRK